MDSDTMAWSISLVFVALLVGLVVSFVRRRQKVVENGGDSEPIDNEALEAAESELLSQVDDSEQDEKFVVLRTWSKFDEASTEYMNSLVEFLATRGIESYHDTFGRGRRLLADRDFAANAEEILTREFWSK